MNPPKTLCRGDLADVSKQALIAGQKLQYYGPIVWGKIHPAPTINQNSLWPGEYEPLGRAAVSRGASFAMRQIGSEGRDKSLTPPSFR